MQELQNKNSKLQYFTVREDDFIASLSRFPSFVLAEAANNPDTQGVACQYHDLADTRLYWGEQAAQSNSISPYLIRLSKDSWAQLKAKICTQKNWGCIWQLEGSYLALPPNHQQLDLLRHLREWTLIAMPDGENSILRLSDWQVLQTLFNASSQVELQRLFGPAKSILTFNALENEFKACTLSVKSPQLKSDHKSPQRLSEKQFQALEVNTQKAYRADYRQHIRQHFTQTNSWSDDKLNAFIDAQKRVAASYQFDSPSDEIKFIGLAMTFGAGFDHFPWAQQVLSVRHNHGAQSKMEALYQQAVKQLDEEALDSTAG